MSGRLAAAAGSWRGASNASTCAGCASGSSTKVMHRFNWWALITSLGASNTVCSSMLRNSRTLPGQL
ncbi:hypothetical protein WR25_14185 [Diploscapter pachys]|uniref:Uncharacterized protein n=1 Tax=Diploscapter pachys TaxID=2018661 RepID=A0A2A2M5V5_9BILA|nr:hypothetical protein WR25_14185 [Diploscapter pachys]